MHNQSVYRHQLLLHYSVASIDTTLHSRLVGQGERARAAQVAMDALVDGEHDHLQRVVRQLRDNCHLLGILNTHITGTRCIEEKGTRYDLI